LLEVTTSTSGQDEDGYTITVADQEEDIGINETITIEGFEEGSQDAELTGMVDICSVEG
jgi:hypothetical protein